MHCATPSTSGSTEALPLHDTVGMLNSKVTVPEGTALPGADSATVAVKVTGWPDTGDDDEEASVVTVGTDAAADDVAVAAQKPAANTGTNAAPTHRPTEDIPSPSLSPEKEGLVGAASPEDGGRSLSEDPEIPQQ